MKAQNLQNSLNTIKSLSTDKYCVQHWRYQRLSAILMLPLLVWLVFFGKAIVQKSPVELVELVKYPYNVLMIILLLITMFFHAAIGLKVIIEDYVNNLAVRYLLIVLVQCFTFVTVVAGIISIILLCINY
ncbi:succinate dehydrogenase, hydrophobic membrane anchor protein [Orientia tsutsugamushi]|uniref:Succinate dehydrogenase hydrophobic membrane anchor subunit n=1 Tax=Orientia tsutsugamushi (strain Boryong) TaxID=357244 RepID=A5CEW4_ORITB|nr:succinate dehydrogenase, hydrophobic membrane anchor protein [Orientia tsutsugamushi]CAM80792.1 Succinate dehydrogenase hydrophobic membrane anchor protein [Orientia tsutsugamushi str. Boryong]